MRGDTHLPTNRYSKTGNQYRGARYTNSWSHPHCTRHCYLRGNSKVNAKISWLMLKLTYMHSFYGHLRTMRAPCLVPVWEFMYCFRARD